ncbi:metal ion binding [Venturia nashicola]|uniref:Metal ion binding n=1 Tax=Venturia nashicola TaxID=86259 RepID=A0A4Z1NQ91_9PEZI|nr:metal ion binding [Venturia nashicola]TLD21661.1 metal ion binding [Venturia nashicola]
MRTSAILLFCTALASAEVKMCPLGPAAAAAPMIPGNPPGATYKAHLKKGSATGTVTLSSACMGVNVELKLKLPKEGAPFMYHIHDKPVPMVIIKDGNCTGTAAHFDPYAISANCMCDKAKKEFCQIGDLSGKAGNITVGGEVNTSFNDMFVSLKPGDKAFVGDKSVVVHSFDNKRIACANLMQSKM